MFCLTLGVGPGLHVHQEFKTRSEAVFAVKSLATRYGFSVVHRDVKYLNRQLKQWKRLVLACEYFGKPHPMRKTTKHLGCPFRINLNYRKKQGIVAVTLAVLTHNHEVPYVSKNVKAANQKKQMVNVVPAGSSASGAGAAENTEASPQANSSNSNVRDSPVKTENFGDQRAAASKIPALEEASQTSHDEERFMSATYSQRTHHISESSDLRNSENSSSERTTQASPSSSSSLLSSSSSRPKSTAEDTATTNSSSKSIPSLSAHFMSRLASSKATEHDGDGNEGDEDAAANERRYNVLMDLAKPICAFCFVYLYTCRGCD